MTKVRVERIGEERRNTQGCLMRIVEYIDCHNMLVEFQDNYKYKTNATYTQFEKGNVKNPYCPSVLGVGMVGEKTNRSTSGKQGVQTKEYTTWRSLLVRCYDNKYQDKRPLYKDSVCCDEWLLFTNFYEWLHSQDNFNKWLNGNRWAVDKDIIIKNNKLYSPDTTCLVPINVNSLFTRHDANRGSLPIGVTKYPFGDGYLSFCHNPITGKQEYIGLYDTVEKAFDAYKEYKENIIKQVAEIEFSQGNITEICYNAMINYKVEITD